MPRQVSQTVYTFSELSDKAKNVARDWFRETNPDTDWADMSLDDFTTILKAVGFRDPKIQYCGFWSQGDGACFTGTWQADCCEVDKIKEFNIPQFTQIASRFIDLSQQFPRASFVAMKTDHMYSHENTVRFEFELDCDNTDLYVDHVATEFKSLSKQLMKWIYGELYKDYEYQNSDEVVDENMQANGYEFFENGKWFRG